MGIWPSHLESILAAAATIRAGGLVAFPTETVYGLGANALDEAAVAGIFAAKGRPSTNPLIVHVASPESAAEVAEVDELARRLMEAFWPGPLTLVLPKQSGVPDIVTAGGSTVAVRQPRHPIAQALLDAAGVPIAAPSANRSESISPTRAEHVHASLGDRVPIILDGGACDVGLESTVLDCTVDPPRILRPGMVTADTIQEMLGAPVAVGAMPTEGAARSPGQMPRHYAPRTPLKICTNVWTAARAATAATAVIARTQPADRAISPLLRTWILGDDPVDYATRLYDAMHDADAAGVESILVEDVPDTEEWRAIRDRLTRAAVSR